MGLAEKGFNNQRSHYFQPKMAPTKQKHTKDILKYRKGNSSESSNILFSTCLGYKYNSWKPGMNWVRMVYNVIRLNK